MQKDNTNVHIAGEKSSYDFHDAFCFFTHYREVLKKIINKGITQGSPLDKSLHNLENLLTNISEISTAINRHHTDIFQCSRLSYQKVLIEKEFLEKLNLMLGD